MSNQQRALEVYWGRCWAAAIGQHLNAEVHSSIPSKDPPDVEFTARSPDGSATTTWGEVTGTYLDSKEAKLLWGRGPQSDEGEVYCEPDRVAALRAGALVQRKRQKYDSLVQQKGRGHLLVVLHSPLTTRTTRVGAERSIQEVLTRPVGRHTDPFDSVWLGYRLPITVASEQEDEEHVYRAPMDEERRNFMKCIWVQEAPEPGN